MTNKEKIRNIIELFIAWNGETDVIDTANIDSAVDFITDSLQEEPVSKDLEKAAVEAFKQIVDSDKNSFLEIFKAGAKWKEEQIMKDAIDAKIGSFVDGTIYDVDFNIDSDLKQDDKIKVIIIKNE